MGSSWGKDRDARNSSTARQAGASGQGEMMDPKGAEHTLLRFSLPGGHTLRTPARRSHDGGVPLLTALSSPDDWLNAPAPSIWAAGGWAPARAAPPGVAVAPVAEAPVPGRGLPASSNSTVGPEAVLGVLGRLGAYSDVCACAAQASKASRTAGMQRVVAMASPC